MKVHRPNTLAKAAAVVAALLTCLPVGGSLHQAFGTGQFDGLHRPRGPLPATHLMVAYPALVILALILPRFGSHEHRR